MNRINVNISAPNLINICVDSAFCHNYTGRLYHKYQMEPERFSDIGQLLGLVEMVCDMSGYPQSTTQDRSFRKKQENTSGKEASQVADMNEMLEQKGDLATFVVHVKYRQHSTWQGEVVWAEKNEKRTFRSALELLKLIDNALDDEES